MHYHKMLLVSYMEMEMSYNLIRIYRPTAVNSLTIRSKMSNQTEKRSCRKNQAHWEKIGAKMAPPEAVLGNGATLEGGAVF